MIKNCTQIGIFVFILVTAFPLSIALAGPGGYAPVPVTNKDVVAAARFAVTAQKKIMNNRNDLKPINLKLIEILSAQQQVVAGMNFRLKLQVKVNTAEKEAEAVVWWQPWRKPDPYRLTSWNWQKNKKQNRAASGGV